MDELEQCSFRIILCLLICSTVLNVRGNSDRTTIPDYINASGMEIQSDGSCDDFHTHFESLENGVTTERDFYSGEALANPRDFQGSWPGNKTEEREAWGEQGWENRKSSNISHRSPRKPLILTPYVKNNNLEAKIRNNLRIAGIKAAKVQPLIRGVRSYSGFLEVDEKKKSFMFFWFFSARNSHFHRSYSRKTPVIVWLQGGLGRSSLYGALRLNGPIRLEDNGTLTLNKYSWAETAHLVYFDSLVGAGYSYTHKLGFSTNQESVASNLYSALKQFLALFNLAENPLYIMGQSYAGKYAISLGAKIHREKDNFYVNLKGFAIGNGLVDPPNMLRYGAYLYQLGFIDLKQRDEFRRIETSIAKLLKENEEEKARDIYADLIEGDINRARPSLIDRIIGPGLKNDYRRVKRGMDEAFILNRFFNQDSIKKTLNVGKIPYMNENLRARRAIWGDLLKSQVQNLQMLLNTYRVLLYQGQTSVKHSYPLVYNYITKMKWRGRRIFLEKRTPKLWMVDGKMAGFYKNGGHLIELVMRNAGRNVPSDQPKRAQRMIENFIYNIGFN